MAYLAPDFAGNCFGSRGVFFAGNLRKKGVILHFFALFE
jgi:hypothetical protein